MKKIIKYLALPLSFTLIPAYALTPTSDPTKPAIAHETGSQGSGNKGEMENARISHPSKMLKSGGNYQHGMKGGNWHHGGNWYPSGREQSYHHGHGGKNCGYTWSKQWRCKGGDGGCSWHHGKKYCGSHCYWHHMKSYRCMNR
jgi:hypothetical protein